MPTVAKEQVVFDIKSEDEDIYRHTYQEERQILDEVKAGNVEEAVRLSKEMDVNIGRLGESEAEHWRNLSIVAITLCARAAGYPLAVTTSVRTSDKSLRAIWEISERTLRRCMHETYEDCPFYEQLQYIMDARTQILYTYAVSADDRLARKCMDDLRRSQRYDGVLNCSYPIVIQMSFRDFLFTIF